MWAAQDVPPFANRNASRAPGSIVSAIGGVALPMALRFMGRRSTRRRRPSLAVVSSPSLSWGGRVSVFVLNRAAVSPELHLVNDLAGTMQPKLVPIGRTPLGKSRGFIHDLNLWFSRSTSQQAGSTFPSMRIGFNNAPAHAVTESEEEKKHLLSGNTTGSVRAATGSFELHPMSRFERWTCRVVVFHFPDSPAPETLHARTPNAALVGDAGRLPPMNPAGRHSSAHVFARCPLPHDDLSCVLSAQSW